MYVVIMTSTVEVVLIFVMFIAVLVLPLLLVLRMLLYRSPTLISYNTLLQSYGKMGAYEHSLGVLQQMCTRCGNHTQSPQCAKLQTTPCLACGIE
jgi:pentatricopeptide repeat protein